MSAYTDSYRLRYQTPSVSEQIEVAVVHAAEDIQNEAADAPNHANRLAWANWVASNSSVAWAPFAWPVGLNPAIQTAIAADPSGGTVQDSDIQFVVNGQINEVIADFIANPPNGVKIPTV